MHSHTHCLKGAGAAIVCLAIAACTDVVGPETQKSQREFRIEAPAAHGTSMPGVVELTGTDADTALRSIIDRGNAAQVRRLALFNNNPDFARARANGARAGNNLGIISVPYADLTGTGTPPEIFDPASLGRPVITSSYTEASIVGSIAVFVSSMTYVGATVGSTDLTWEVKNKDGTLLFPPTTSHFSEMAPGVPLCIAEIVAFKANPTCILNGSVHGLVEVGLPRNCDVTASAYSLHGASLALPKPAISVSPGGWSVGIGPLFGFDAYPVGNGKVDASGPACERIETRRVPTAGGGDIGGMFLMFEERQITTTCYAIQDRTVQSDGSASDWVTIGVECYSSFASLTAGTSPSAPTVKGVPFTLVGVGTGAGNGRAQIIRRGKGSTDTERDVVALSLNTATADDLSAAIKQYLTKAGRTRQFNDAVEAVSGTAKASGFQKSNYDELLKALRNAPRRNVEGLGDAATIPVIVIP